MTESERLQAWMREQELEALALLQKAVVDIAHNREKPVEIARFALRRLSLEHPEVVELLLARAAERVKKPVVAQVDA